MNGALLIDKPAGISSFGVIELLQASLMQRLGIKRRDLPKLGHGGTLDPFATGLLIVCVGPAVKLARYFLGSSKVYEGLIRFGETTVPGDPTSPVSERSEQLPDSVEPVRALAAQLARQPYLQTPPMHSAKKKDGRPLYELARQGIEVEREPKLCHLYSFEIQTYESPLARFRLHCSSGTYVRTLAQDFGRMLGSVAMLDSLRRTHAGAFNVENAWTPARVSESSDDWNTLPCWVGFDRLMEGYDRAQATPDEADSLIRGQQSVLFNILKRVEAGAEPSRGESHVAIYTGSRLIAVARGEQGVWAIERVFANATSTAQA